MNASTVDALLEEVKEAARRYERCRDGQDLDVLLAQADVKRHALAWARAERELLSVTCPAPRARHPVTSTSLAEIEELLTEAGPT